MDGVVYTATILIIILALTFRFIEKRHKKHISALLRQIRAEASTAGKQVFCSRELFTLDWANTLIGATWGTGLERILSAKLATILEAALARIIQGQARKGPLRYLERIKVDALRLGKQQPALSSCTASTDAAAGCVRLALPFSFDPAEGFSIVLALYVRPAKVLPAFATRVAVTSFSMKGELLLSFHTSPGEPPGISSLGMSFAQPPAIDFNFQTFALAFGDLPFLLDMLKELAQKALTAKMVEPQKLSIDLTQRWTHDSTSPTSEPQPPASEPNPSSTARTGSAAAQLADTAVDVTAVHQVVRALWPPGRKSSSPQHTTGTAAITDSTSAKSAGPTPAAQEPRAASLPHQAGSTKVHVAAFTTDAQAAAGQLRPIREAEERLSAGNWATAGACMDEMSMDPSLCTNARTTRDDKDGTGIAAEHCDSTVPAAWGSLHENAGNLKEGAPMRRTQESHGVLASELPESFQLVDTASSPPNEVADNGTSAVDIAGKGGRESHQHTGYQHHTFSEHEAGAELASLRANLAALQKRIAAEQLRALVEGAPFVVHTAAGTCLQYLWLQKQTESLLCGLKREVENQPSKEDAGKADVLKKLLIADILDFKAGCAAFPKVPSKRSSWVAIKGLLAQPRHASSSGASGNMLLHAAEDSRCFSILAESQSLHLELPQGGNGRSRREWMDAIVGLDACGVNASTMRLNGEAHPPSVRRDRAEIKNVEP